MTHRDVVHSHGSIVHKAHRPRCEFIRSVQEEPAQPCEYREEPHVEIWQVPPDDC